MSTLDNLTALKRRANIIFREWSPRLGDELRDSHFMLGDSLDAKIASAQRVLDLTGALRHVINEMHEAVCLEFNPRLQAMKRSQAAVKANQTRKARKAKAA